MAHLSWWWLQRQESNAGVQLGGQTPELRIGRSVGAGGGRVGKTPMRRHGRSVVAGELADLVAQRDHQSETPIGHGIQRPRPARAEIDAVVLAASRPGRTLGDVFQDLAAAYAERGFAGEWRRHHQGGLAGYEGREVFATPTEPTVIPDSCAVAWNPSVTGGAKSEDTALVTSESVEVITRTPDLPELELNGLARPAIVEL